MLCQQIDVLSYEVLKVQARNFSLGYFHASGLVNMRRAVCIPSHLFKDLTEDLHTDYTVTT